MTKKKILITGVAGFIGYTLAKKLLEGHFSIIGLDNLNEYYDVDLKNSRISDLNKISDSKDSNNFLFKKVDLKDKQSLGFIIEEYRPDTICHLAAQAGVRYSITHPQSYIDNNITGTLNLLECSKEFGIKDFIFASTSSVYGLSEKMPFKEDLSISTPISVYSSSKYSCELLCHTYHYLYGIRFRILRFFTVYGPWGRPDMALFLFTKAILEGQPIKVFNNGKMKRDFTYIDDIVEGFKSAIDNKYDFEIFNLGYGQAVELNTFINILESNLDIESKKIMMPLQPGDVPSTWSDISKAKKMLNYRPNIDVSVGIKNFVDWYLEYYKNDNV